MSGVLCALCQNAARTLLAMLQGGRTNITKGMTAPEREQEQKLKTELATLSTQVGREQQREADRRDPAILRGLIARGKQAQQNLDTFRTKLFTTHPELKALRGEAPANKLSQ